MPRQEDDFGDAKSLRLEAVRQARRLWHVLGRFVVRKSDATKADAFCERCNMLAIVNTNPDGSLPSIYGHALLRRCRPRDKKEGGHA